MASVLDHIKALRKLDGAMNEIVNPWLDPLRSSSPYLNSIYGKGWGLPRGYSTLLWGAQKGGKSLIINDVIGQLHQSDPDALAIIYDAEFRRKAQLTPDIAKSYGIDWERMIVYETNSPAKVWDNLREDVVKLIRGGAKIPLVAIDSVTSVLGRQEMDSNTVTKQLRGDRATTTQIGLQKLIEFQRECGFHLILTAQARAEMDPNKAMRNDKKAAASFGCFHHCEFFCYVERIESKKGSVDALGRELRDESKKDAMDSGDKTGQRVRVWMEDSSMGPKDRTGEFTVSFREGICNQHEEVFELGCNWGIIKRPNNLSYEYGGQKWAGKPAMLNALMEPGLQKAVIDDLMKTEK